MPEVERARVAKVYSAMSDEELCQLAESGDLSDAAQEALHVELEKRGISAEVNHSDAEDVFEFDGAVTVRQFRDLPEALLAKGSLESAGIAAHLVDDNMVRMDWFISNLLGGIKLKVRPEDREAATDILNQPIPAMLDVDGIGDFEQPHCPRCQSLDINYQQLNKLVAYGSAYFGVPIPAQTSGWTCHACGNRWEEPGHETAETDESI